MSTAAAALERTEQVRRFNRFYTRRIGVLHEHLPGSDFSLAESRVLWELAHASPTRPGPTATELALALALDAGYLSRLLRGLKERGLIGGIHSPHDGRQTHLSLTAAGRQAFAPLDSRSRAQVGELLGALGEAQQQQLLQAFDTLTRLLDPQAQHPPVVVSLRRHGAGDLGWLIARHGALYAQEYGWDLRFEALVARIAAEFVERFDAAREACWIAEHASTRAGCVVLVQSRDDTTQQPLPGVAQLRLLLVEPEARGLGLGTQLIDQCTDFARSAGYTRIRLWTNSVLAAARHLYQRAGYRLVASEPHHSFGHDLVGEIWELEL